MHHFIFGKNVCFCNYFVCFGFVLSFSLLCAFKEKESTKEKEISLGIRTLRVHYGSLNHCLQSKHLQALGLYAHKAHNRNEVASVDIELLNFRSKFLGLVPENLCTKILTNSNW